MEEETKAADILQDMEGELEHIECATEGPVIILDDENLEDNVILIDDESQGGNEEKNEPQNEEKNEESKPIRKKSSTVVMPEDGWWRVRVCPIIYDDFCNKKEFTTILKMAASSEYRMSQFLSSSLAAGSNTITSAADRALPWLPNEKIYRKPQNSATAGLLEMKVHDTYLVKVIKGIRNIDLSKRTRFRFEMKRLPKEVKTDTEEVKTDTEEVKTDTEEVKTDTEEMKTDTAEVETDTAEVETDTSEVKDGEEVKTEAEIEFKELTVNFSVRMQQVKVEAFSHKKGYVLKPEDKQIFLSQIPDEVPDNVLECIMLTQMIERKKGADNTGTATFPVDSKFGAPVFMELYDGVLINLKDGLEMATTLGTLTEAKKKHLVKEYENRTVNEKKIEGMKRKRSSTPDGEKSAKKPRRDPLNPAAQIWLLGGPNSVRVANKATRGGRGGANQAATRGKPSRGRGMMPSRGRGLMPPPLMGRMSPRGRGVSPRGRGGMERGGGPRGGGPRGGGPRGGGPRGRGGAARGRAGWTGQSPRGDRSGGRGDFRRNSRNGHEGFNPYEQRGFVDRYGW